MERVKEMCRFIGFVWIWIIRLKFADGVMIPVGNPIIESSSTFDVVGNLFVFDRVQVPFNGTVFSITGYFLNTNPSIVQVWRPVGDNPQWDLKLIHEIEFTPSVSEEVETIILHQMTNAECFVVTEGDVIGVFIRTIPSPVTYIQNFNDPNTLRKKFNDPATFPITGDIITVDTLNFPYQFSIYITVDIGDLRQGNGGNCSDFYKRAAEYQALLPEVTTTEAMNLTTMSLKGEPGATGPIGPSGPKGDQGDTGPAGADGTAGATGAVGPAGESGPAGSPGEKGEVGPKGESGGRDGSTGAPGVKGDKGDQGLQGSTGPMGGAGATGVSGVTGAKGDLGIQGATGLDGQRGRQGIKGDVGAAGAPGPQGPPGPISGNSSKELPQAGAASDGLPSTFGLLSDNIILLLLIWQSLTTMAILVCCACYICRRKNKGLFTQRRKVTSADAYIVSNVNSVTTDTVTHLDGPSFSGSSRVQDKRKMETNLSWAFVKEPQKYKPNGLIGSTNQFYPQDYD